jgi:hypothetical protein
MPFLFYGRYLDGSVAWPSTDAAYARHDGIAAVFRAPLETALGAVPAGLRRQLATIANAGGAERRGTNSDPYIWLADAWQSLG